MGIRGDKTKEKTLYCLKLIPPGEQVEIFNIATESSILRRLRDLGLKEGAVVEVVSRDPLARKMILRMGESLFALDEDLCNGILVRPLIACYREMKERVYYDILTGCCRREFVEETLERLVTQVPCALVLVDLDDFKRINDTYGHLCGDCVLREIGKVLRNNIRKQDLAVRWGGDEFLVYLTRAPIDLAQRIGERLRSEIIKMSFMWEGEMVRVTASVGVCGVPPIRSFEELLKAVDQALYQAKREGKNRVVLCLR